MRARTIPTLLVLLAATTACQTDLRKRSDAPGSEVAAERGGEASDRKQEELENRQEELDKARRELGLWAAEARLAEQKTEDEVAKAELAVAKAEREREEAEAALERFRELEGPLATSQAELAVERAENRLVSEKQDLEGIRSIYDEETEAPARDEIVRRHEMSVHFAERALGLAKLQQANEVDHELPAKARGLEWKLHEATVSVHHARSALERSRMTGDLEEQKRNDAKELLERKVERLEKRVAKAQDELDEGEEDER